MAKFVQINIHAEIKEKMDWMRLAKGQKMSEFVRRMVEEQWVIFKRKPSERKRDDRGN